MYLIDAEFINNSHKIKISISKMHNIYLKVNVNKHKTHH